MRPPSDGGLKFLRKILFVYTCSSMPGVKGACGEGVAKTIKNGFSQVRFDKKFNAKRPITSVK